MIGLVGRRPTAPLSWEKNGTRGSCRPDNTSRDPAINDPTVITYCGFEGQTMNLLTSPVVSQKPSIV